VSAVTASVAAARPGAWRQALLLLGGLVVALLLLYRDTAAAMVGIWSNSNTFAHAFLVPPIALWLVWRMRAPLARLQPEPQPWLLLPMLAASAVWLLGDMAAINAVTQLMFVALLVMTVVAVLGLRIGRELAFPLAFLFFMVPIGEFMLPTLMNWTADFTVAALRLSGVPVYREGLNFIIPSGAWSVVEACSGIRYMIASFMVGTLFAYLNYTSRLRRVAFCAVALVVPLLANWLRAYLIVMLGHLSDNRLAAGVDHLVYGWVFFGFIVMVMYFIGARWSQAPADLVAVSGATAAASARAFSRAWWLAAAMAAVLAWPHLPRWQGAALDTSPMPALRLPELPGAGSAGPQALVLQPVFVNPDAVAERAYAVAGGDVAVHVAYYRHQVFGRKLVSSNNMLLPPDALPWSRTAGGQATVRVGDAPLALLSAELRSKGLAVGSSERDRMDVRQVYWVDGSFTSSGARAGLTALLGRFNGRGDAAAMLTFYTRGDSPEDTRQRLDSFIGSHLGTLQTMLAEVRAAHQGAAAGPPGRP
jgi:exosortase A